MLCYRKYINTNDFRLYSGMELYKVIVPTLIFFSKNLWPTLMIQNSHSVQIIVGKMDI